MPEADPPDPPVDEPAMEALAMLPVCCSASDRPRAVVVGWLSVAPGCPGGKVGMRCGTVGGALAKVGSTIPSMSSRFMSRWKSYPPSSWKGDIKPSLMLPRSEPGYASGSSLKVGWDRLCDRELIEALGDIFEPDEPVEADGLCPSIGVKSEGSGSARVDDQHSKGTREKFTHASSFPPWAFA